LGKLGNYAYPEYTLAKTLDRIKRAYTALKEGISVEGLAEALGMAPRGGAFLNVAAAMRTYGLVAGTGILKTTDLGERLVHPIFGEEDERRAREEAWLNIDLIRKMHERFKGKVPARIEEFSAILREITGAERAEIERKGKKAWNLYQKALPNLSLIEEAAEIPEAAEAIPKRREEVAVAIPLPADMMEFKYGGIYLRIPAAIASKIIPIVIEYVESKKATEAAS
jgi:hypothetical protein